MLDAGAPAGAHPAKRGGGEGGAVTDVQGPFGRWDPASLSEVAARFSGLPARWWVAGGLAIELAVRHRIRAHGDIDVLLLRQDQGLAQRALASWQ